jgi:hypothetical protein
MSHELCTASPAQPSERNTNNDIKATFHQYQYQYQCLRVVVRRPGRVHDSGTGQTLLGNMMVAKVSHQLRSREVLQKLLGVFEAELLHPTTPFHRLQSLSKHFLSLFQRP